MRQTIAAVAAAAALALSGTVVSAGTAQAGAGTAQAGVPCTITGFTPTTVVVGLSPVTKTFNVLTSGCIKGAWSLTIGPRNVFSTSPQETFSYPSNTKAGNHDVVAKAFSSDYTSGTEVTLRNAFHLKRADRWASFNAGPGRVKRGSAITVQGKLYRANWDTNRYERHASQYVKVQFRTPTGSYVTVKTVKTNAYGGVKTKVTARRSGFWRLVYFGNTISSSAASNGDGVKVS